MKIDAPLLDANLNAARRESNNANLTVRAIATCGGCAKDATVMVAGHYPRCQPCANRVLSIWAEMRAAKNGD